MSAARSLILLGLPGIAIVLGILWYRRKNHQSDPGGSAIPPPPRSATTTAPRTVNLEPISETAEIEKPIAEKFCDTCVVGKPKIDLNKSLPIDIPIGSPVELTDDQLDQEIAKIQSQKSQEKDRPLFARSMKQLAVEKKELLLEKSFKTVLSAAATTTPTKVINNTTANGGSKVVQESTKNKNMVKIPQEQHTKNIKTAKRNMDLSEPNLLLDSFEPIAEKPCRITKITTAPADTTDGCLKNDKIVTSLVTSQQHQQQQDDNLVDEACVLDHSDSDLVVVNSKKDNNDSDELARCDWSQELCELEEGVGKDNVRDSAYHSPTENMSSSPQLSTYSDRHSEHSEDSGKGSSPRSTEDVSSSKNTTANKATSTATGATTGGMAVPPTIKTANVVSKDQTTAAGAGQQMALISVYEFSLPQSVVGRLIGRNGAYVHRIKSLTGADILVKRHPDGGSRLKICSVEGLQTEIDAALAMIRNKFPEKKFPNITMEPVSVTHHNSNSNRNHSETTGSTNGGLPELSPECVSLLLIEGVNNDCTVSCVQAAAADGVGDGLSAGLLVSLQQPLHPSFPSLNLLQCCMAQTYAPAPASHDIPALPRPVTAGMVCACPLDCGWYRAQITNVFDPSYTTTTNSYTTTDTNTNSTNIINTENSNDTCESTTNTNSCSDSHSMSSSTTTTSNAEEDEEGGDVQQVELRLVDYGDHVVIGADKLRQIRADLMMLPFQAVDCLLANVQPANGATEWSQESVDCLRSLTFGRLLQAQIYGFLDDVPLVHLYCCISHNQVMFVNQELVARGLADWVEVPVTDLE